MREDDRASVRDVFPRCVVSQIVLPVLWSVLYFRYSARHIQALFDEEFSVPIK